MILSSVVSLYDVLLLWVLVGALILNIWVRRHETMKESPLRDLAIVVLAGPLGWFMILLSVVELAWEKICDIYDEEED